MGRLNFISQFDGEKWQYIKSSKELNNCIGLKFNLVKYPDHKESYIVKAISNLQKIHSIEVQLESSIEDKLLTKLFSNIAQTIQSTTSLQKLIISFRYCHTVLTPEIIDALSNCVIPNLSCVVLQFIEIEDILMEKIISKIQRLENLTDLTLKLENMSQDLSQQMFEGLKIMKQLRRLSIKIQNQTPSSDDSKPINLILPGCSVLSLTIGNCQLFSSLHNFENLKELTLILDKSYSENLSTNILNQLSKLHQLQRVTIKFQDHSQNLLSFAGKIIDICQSLNELTLTFSSHQEINCQQVLSHLSQNKSISRVSIKLKEDVVTKLSDIDVTCLSNIKNLKITYKPYKHGHHEQLLKNLGELQNLQTLETVGLKQYFKEILKSKNLVTYINN